jgi:hypothetical protein
MFQDGRLLGTFPVVLGDEHTYHVAGTETGVQGRALEAKLTLSLRAPTLASYIDPPPQAVV